MTIIIQIILNILINGAIYGGLAFGFYLIFRAVKFFDMSYGIIPVIAAYFVILFKEDLNLSLSISIIFSIILSVIIYLLIYFIVYKKMRKDKAKSNIFLIASLGVYTFLVSMIQIFFTSQFKTISNTLNIESINIWGGYINNIQSITILLFFIIFIFLILFLKYTKYGKSFRAVADDEEVAKTIGIDTENIIVKTFILSGIIGSIFGILLSFDIGVTPFTGFTLLLKVCIVYILANSKSIVHIFIFAIVLSLIENLAVYFLNAEWKDIIAYMTLIIFLLINNFNNNKK